MPKMIQIRHVPDEFHRLLKTQAAAAGMSLSDYLLRELEAVVTKQKLAELFAEIEREPPVDFDPEETLKIINEGRGERQDRIAQALEEARERSK